MLYILIDILIFLKRNQVIPTFIYNTGIQNCHIQYNGKNNIENLNNYFICVTT